MSRQDLMHLTVRVSNEAASNLLVRHSAHALEDMAKRTMAQIMQQRRREAGQFIFFIDPGNAPQLLDHLPRRLHHAQTVAVTRMIGARVGQARHPKLANAPKTLNLLRL